MERKVFSFTGRVLLAALLICTAAKATDDGKLRIIVFGAHPDDCEIKAGGMGAMWASQGHHVKFVSVCNGDLGHWKIAGGPLAQRRKKEVEAAAKILGIEETQVLDIHDGELMPTLENRKTIIRLIREWKADIVMAHRSNDYMADHRYVGVLVDDAAFMVTVPFLCPDVPHLSKNPVFLYLRDGFRKPYPFEPDIVIPIDAVIEKKLEAISVIDSQFSESGCCAPVERQKIPKNEAELAAARRQTRARFRRRFAGNAKKYRDRLIELYGEEKGKKVQYAEAFEICEYGGRLSEAEIKQLFPFFWQ
ncbi:MAG: PIG-L deacetylase family protein [Planctomycetota bacterium]|jgi:LmbE family N-acetylglucosaminyl deacetylase